MAVNAKFAADFSSFLTAVQKADVSLKTFETGAGKVEKALTRMADGFSGTKVIQDANLAAAAVEKIGGASKLTQTEQQRVNAQVTEALAKFKALGQQAPQALHDLANATKAVPEQLSLATKGADLLKSSFGQFTAANLAASAIQSVVGEVQRFISQGSKLRGVEQSFQQLSDGVKQNSGAMLSALQEGTNGLVSNLDLMTQANKAVLLGLPVTTKSMGELAKTATTLGKAMGQDATKSLDDLITALGRSSPLILDNLGLTVKIGEANEAYATKLGKTVEQLTEADKKTAFYEAAMEAARKKTSELGDQTLTLGERMSSVWVKVENSVTKRVSEMNVVLGDATASWGKFFGFIADAAQFKSWEELAKKLEAPRKVGMPIIDPGALARESAVFKEEMAAAEKAYEDGEKAAKDHAKAIATLRDELAGKGTIKAAQDMVQALKGLPPVHTLTAATQERINKAMEAALEVYRAQGTVAPAAIRRIAAATFDLSKLVPPISEGLSAGFAMVGKQAEMAIPDIVALYSAITDGLPKVVTGIDNLNLSTGKWRVELPKAAKESAALTEHITALAQAMTQLSQTAGGTVINALASMVNGFNVGLKAVDSLKDGFKDLTSGKGLSSILSGFTGIVSGIGGIVGAAQAAIQIGKALFSVFDRDKGRDLVEDFAAEFSGGFDGPNGLHQQLLKLGDEGEQLWIKLTQKVGRNNIDQARAAIEEVRQALERLKSTADSFGGITYHPPDISIDPSGEVPEFATGTGGFRNFGSRGKLVKLHNWEAVVRPGDPMPGGGGGGEPIVINLHAGVYASQQILVDTLSRAYRVQNKVRAV